LHTSKAAQTTIDQTVVPNTHHSKKKEKKREGLSCRRMAETCMTLSFQEKEAHGCAGWPASSSKRGKIITARLRHLRAAAAAAAAAADCPPS
jgi:hypothetical protein